MINEEIDSTFLCSQSVHADIVKIAYKRGKKDLIEQLKEDYPSSTIDWENIII